MLITPEQIEEMNILAGKLLKKDDNPRKAADMAELARLKELQNLAEATAAENENNEPPINETQPPEGEDNEEEKAKPQYAFPSKSRCPRCQTTDTKAYTTKGKYQYRECLRAICRKTYTVEGKEI